MVPQIKCAMLVRGSKTNCEKLRKEFGFELKQIEKDGNHYRMFAIDYYPCDMMMDCTFDEMAEEFSVDIAYMFTEYSNQLCQYDEDYNLKCFLDWNEIDESGLSYGFANKTGATDDLALLKEFMSN